MASHQVAIAKASLAAALLRRDPTPVNRDAIAHFHTLLDDTITRCSTSNIQRCKDWLVDNVVHSSDRITALRKYLSALSESIVDENGQPAEGSNGQIPLKYSSARRRRLHILYLLHDLLHHTKYHSQTESAHTRLAIGLQPQLSDLFKLAASVNNSRNPRLRHKLSQLLDLWEKQSFYDPQTLKDIQQAVEDIEISSSTRNEAGSQDNPAVQRTQTNKWNKDAPWLMPATHGEPSTPWYDLPAACLIPHITENSTKPMKPELIKPLEFTPGPIDEKLKTAVQDFLNDVDEMYRPKIAGEDGDLDVDEMGQILAMDNKTGQYVIKETYYGWSCEFCDRMKEIKKRKRASTSNGRDGGSNRDRSRDRSSSRASSAPRMSRRDRRSSVTRSRSRGSRYDSQKSPDRSQSQSRSPARNGKTQRASHAGATTMTSLQTSAPRGGMEQSFVTPIDQIDNPFAVSMPPKPTAPNANAFQHNFPIGPGGLPIPPPPPFHQGPWPPPPPTLPAGNPHGLGQYPNFSNANFQHGNFVTPPPMGWRPQQQSPNTSGHWQDQPVPPPPPPPSLGSGWQESRDQSMEYGQNQRPGGMGSGRGSDNWNRGRGPRR